MEQFWPILAASLITGGCTLTGVALVLKQNNALNNKKRQNNARYLATLLSFIFDKYANNCLKVIDDDGFTEGRYAGPQIPLPKTPDFPTNVDWTSINHQLMCDLLSFPSDIEEASSHIDFVIEYGSGPPYYDEVFEERQLQYAQLGLKAVRLVQCLNNEYNIFSGNSTYGKYHDHTEKFTNKITTIKTKRERRQYTAHLKRRERKRKEIPMN